LKKYIGIYRVFPEVCLDSGKPSTNQDDTYLKCKNNNQIYRYNKNTLAILFTSTKSKNKYLPDIEKLKVKIRLLSEGNFESIYLFPEKDLAKVASILKPQTKGKNINPFIAERRKCG